MKDFISVVIDKSMQKHKCYNAALIMRSHQDIYPKCFIKRGMTPLVVLKWF